MEGSLENHHNKIYQPILTKDKYKNTVVKLKKQYPKEPLDLINLKDIQESRKQVNKQDLNTEPASSVINDTIEEIKIVRADSGTPDKIYPTKINSLSFKDTNLLNPIKEKQSLSDCKLNLNEILQNPLENFSESSNTQNDELKLKSSKAEVKCVVDHDQLLLSERSIKNVTVQAYFDDPLLPYRMREVIMMKENKQLLLHYETSLPSWAVVMATYAYYQPWFRKFQYWFMMILSIITMMVGFFDLYKNLPFVKEFLKAYLSFIWDWLEENVLFRFI